MRAAPKYFIDATGPEIRLPNAVAAILVLPDGRYVMQLRDDRPDIVYPGHWGCFGGAVRAGESTVDALRRELREELEFEVEQAEVFAQFDFQLGATGQRQFYRAYFQVTTSLERARRFVLHEGAELGIFEGEALLVRERVAPHDAFAIWLHLSRRRIQ